MNRKRLIEWLFFAFLVFLLTWAVLAQAQTKEPTITHAATTFDHSNCQYPDRTTNPPDGCDNSDPCDPATTKGGSGDCEPVTTPVQAQMPMSQNVVTPKSGCSE